MDDAQLLTELQPTVERLFERHVESSREWFAHELVPWSRGRDFEPGAPFDASDAGLSEAARSALLVNLLTEDNLPHYLRVMAERIGDNDAWNEWAFLWTAEEGRHAIVIRDYLTVTRAIDLRELERARMTQVRLGVVPRPANVMHGIVYVALQELATRVAHRNTGRLLDDPPGRDIMNRVAADENRHHLYYRDLVSAALLLDPSGMTTAIEHEVSHFAMPGLGIPGFRAHARRIADAGVYDFAVHHDQILVPLVLNHWRVGSLENLDTAGEEARLRLVDHIARVQLAAERTKGRRERLASSLN